MKSIQDAIESNPSLSGHARLLNAPVSIPDFDPILNQVRSASTDKLLTVEGIYRISGQVTKFQEITFHQASVLEIECLNLPWVVIATKTLRLVAPQVRSLIRREFIDQDSLRGADGARGADGIGYRGDDPTGHGRPGGHGHPGAPGGPGSCLSFPSVALIIGEVVANGEEWAKAESKEWAKVEFVVNFNGIDGGDGGAGGDGGNGGGGERGTPSDSGFCWCNRAAGRGGNGGNGGSGGAGGHGSNGSDGSTIYILGPVEVLERLAFFTYETNGGAAGRGGQPGRPGSPAPGGLEGKATGCCGISHRGAGDFGHAADPLNFGVGQPGSEGGRGAITLMVRDVEDLLI